MAVVDMEAQVVVVVVIPAINITKMEALFQVRCFSTEYSMWHSVLPVEWI